MGPVSGSSRPTIPSEFLFHLWKMTMPLSAFVILPLPFLPCSSPGYRDIIRYMAHRCSWDLDEWRHVPIQPIHLRIW